MISFRCNLPRQTFDVDVSMQIERNHIYSLFGPSGSGKSSVLSVMAGFETNYKHARFAIENRLLVDTEQKHLFVPAWQRNITLIEQGAKLFPHLSVLENICYGASRREDHSYIDAWIDRLQLGHYLHHRPSELSGGLVQCVLFARAMVTRPEILLLDEPFSALDLNLRRLLQDAVMEIQQQQTMTVIFVTHQLSEAQRLANQMAVIFRGHILQEGSPLELMRHPVSFEVARMLGYTSLLPAGNGTHYAMHPDRVLVGTHPEQGPTFTGRLLNLLPHEGAYRAEIKIESAPVPSTSFEISLPISACYTSGEILTFTLIQPPTFQNI